MVSDTSVLSLILSGGKGQRLYPLTKARAKSAVPFAGKFRLIDIALSNCIHSGFRKIYILTQWISAFLHNYITRTYQFNGFEKEFIEILAAEQTYEHTDWYNGTADAVRMSWPHLCVQNPAYYLILSSDQLFRMDLNDFFYRHLATGAQISVAAMPVSFNETAGMGLMRIDRNGRIVEFAEKPEDPEIIGRMKVPDDHPDKARTAAEGKPYLASMGIYLFNADVLEAVLQSPFCDFGSEVLPTSLDTYRTFSYVFHGFWKDVGTIGTYYSTSLGLSEVQPAFNFFDEDWPIYSNETGLPASKLNSCFSARTLTSDGCIITGARLENCIIGPRTVIENDSHLSGVICLGNEHYESGDQKAWNRSHNVPDLGIGEKTLIRKTIIDENVRIGRSCVIGLETMRDEDHDTPLYSIRDGIIIIPEGTIIPDGTII